MRRKVTIPSHYRVFTRTWWKINSEWPNGLEPSLGHKTTIADRISDEKEAVEIAQAWNAKHKPGRLSRKAEIEMY